MKHIIDNIPEKPIQPETITEDMPIKNSSLYQETQSSSFDSEREKLLEIFLASSAIGDDLKYYKKNLNKKMEIAKLLAKTLKQCQKNIIYIRNQLEICKCYSEKCLLITELEEQQTIYRKALEDLRMAKNETSRLEFGLNQTEVQAEAKFSKWLQQRNNDDLKEKYNYCKLCNKNNSSSFEDCIGSKTSSNHNFACTNTYDYQSELYSYNAMDRNLTSCDSICLY